MPPWDTKLIATLILRKKRTKLLISTGARNTPEEDLFIIDYAINSSLEKASLTCSKKIPPNSTSHTSPHSSSSCTTAEYSSAPSTLATSSNLTTNPTDSMCGNGVLSWNGADIAEVLGSGQSSFWSCTLALLMRRLDPQRLFKPCNAKQTCSNPFAKKFFIHSRSINISIHAVAALQTL